MKIITNLFTILLISNLSLHATGTCTDKPTTENISSTGITQPAGATDIDNLKGTNCDGEALFSFKIKTLPLASEGILSLANGTPVTVGQTLTEAEANGLKFDPADDFVDDATFTYVAIDDRTGEGTIATVTIPVIGGACTEAPNTDNKANDNMANTLAATDIIDLSGKDCAGTEVTKYKIKSLPNANAGVLYMADGVTVVTVGQVLIQAEANGLKFDPADGFVGDANFTYTSIDNQDREDASPAMVTIPVTAGGGVCTEAPTTDDKANSNLVNTLSAVNILNLDGKDCAGHDVEKFKIKSLPDANAGVLYMADGQTPVTIGQLLTREEANGLKFDPANGFVGTANFTYVSIDNQDREDASPATVTLPVIADGNTGGHPGGGVCNEAPSSDNKANDNLLNTLGAVNILDLSGVNCNGEAVEKFKITTLPDANAGVLYMADGKTPVTIGQLLTREEANGLKFDPADGFVGTANFTYASIDNKDREDASPATVTLPVIAGNGGACHEAPISNDIDNPNLTNTLPAINILNLDGKDCVGKDVESFRIVTLPNANTGVLYMADGVTPVKVGQLLTRDEANGLRFDPADNFVGDAIFTYVAIDADGRADETPATVTLPIVAGANGNGHSNGGCNTGDANCTCEDYSTSVPASTPLGLIIMALLTLLIVRKSLKKEI